jgi:hypothetical protein
MKRVTLLLAFIALAGCTGTATREPGVSRGDCTGCFTNCFGASGKSEAELTDVLRLGERCAGMRFVFNTNEVINVKVDLNAPGIKELIDRQLPWPSFLAEVLSKSGYAIRQDAVDTNLYFVSKGTK